MRRQAFGLVGSAKGRTADGSNQRFEARHLKGDLSPFKLANQNLSNISDIFLHANRMSSAQVSSLPMYHISVT